MSDMGRVDDDRGGGAAAWRGLAAWPYTPITASVLLGMLAVAQAVWVAVSPHGSLAGQNASTDWPFVLVVLVLVCLATTLPLGFLWSKPSGAALALSAASVLSLAAFQTLTVPGMVAQLAGAYRLGRRGSPLLAAALALPFLILALASPAGSSAKVPAVLLASLGPVAGLAGTASRVHREAIEHSAAREAIAGTLLEHTARGERARISRELHDVVAHHISMIAVQAETARLTTPGMPAAGAQRLSSIGDTARAALTEMRRLLGVLREDTETDVVERQPQPGLRQLNELLDEARDASGSGARLILRGAPIALDPGVELAAYRIVQEALTNARRHAPGSAVDVELQYADDWLRLVIRDNGPGLAAAPPDEDVAHGGHGLLGMRERAAAVGGELSTGEAAGGGFLVSASLPGKGERT